MVFGKGSYYVNYGQVSPELGPARPPDAISAGLRILRALVFVDKRCVKFWRGVECPAIVSI